MDNTRITIPLKQCERAALAKLAEIELRDPRNQARHIVRCELERRGLLQPASDEDEQTEPKSNARRAWQGA